MQVLRKAHIIAVKLNLTEFDAWIQGELHGYTCEAEKLPAYRHMKGELKAKNPRTGWIPAISSIQNGQTLDTIPIYESLSSLIDVGQQAKGNYFCYSYPPEVSMKICRQAGAPTYMEIALFISTHRIVEAVEQVKNCLLEWTHNLESKGILGENMAFNETETEFANGLPQQVNYYYGPVVHGNVSGSQIVSGSGNTATFYGAESEMIHEVRESLEKESISEDDMEIFICHFTILCQIIHYSFHLGRDCHRSFFCCYRCAFDSSTCNIHVGQYNFECIGGYFDAGLNGAISVQLENTANTGTIALNQTEAVEYFCQLLIPQLRNADANILGRKTLREESLTLFYQPAGRNFTKMLSNILNGL